MRRLFIKSFLVFAVSNLLPAMRAVSPAGLYHFTAMRAFVGKRFAHGAYEHHAKAGRAYVCFRYNVIIAVKQFHSDNTPVDNKYDKLFLVVFIEATSIALNDLHFDSSALYCDSLI